ncbi:hypothetical protein GGH12_003016 [Coemansia sp. RSA 1822]|nr:hypothetical protein LPJ76_002867 [Coemansia sp. RSA 638]KAJ2542513.1 hypothetical protein GGF49_002799 [Coemansia sp. RSA 1853]KAJ2562698.1 hypothetical protein GGH12_003016 [Coemansia sp. RSA 1822]
MTDTVNGRSVTSSPGLGHKVHDMSERQEAIESMRASLYSSLGSTGKSPFAPSGGDKASAAYLTHCYEQLTRNAESDTSSAVGSVADSNHTHPESMPPPLSAVTSAALGRILRSSVIDEPQTHVFIFTNPRSGNQQGRSLMNMALHSFRLRDRPDVQVQIYDVTDEESLKDGLHYIHQLQLRQGDRLLKTAFPELFDEHRGIRPSPSVCTAQCRHMHSGRRADVSGHNGEQRAQVPACPNGMCGTSSDAGSTGAWEEWIADATAQLQTELGQISDEDITNRLEQAQDSALKLHVWSAGGDGTVSSTLEALMGYGIDVGRLYFSSIPFGTGNDFADALGWGRSVPGDGVGESMRLLNKMITERLDGYTCKLDIYEVTITTYDGGHVKHVEKDMAAKPGARRYTCLMIDYFSLGVQGFVGSSFELHRPGSRSLNILMYTIAAAKWVFLKKFPPINEALESISTVPDTMAADSKLSDAERALWLETASEAERKQVLLARVAGPRKRSHGRKMKWAKEPKARRTATARDFGDGVDEDLPVIQDKPIEIDIQNVARFWGRNIDVWTGAHDASMLSSASGVADQETWTPQYAGDGKLELFGVRNIGDYALNQLPARKSYRISRLAQMGSPVALHFRAPENYPPRSINPLTSHKSIKQGLLYAMCDGEFIEMYLPRDIIVSRKVTLKAVGKSPEASRIVLDTIKNDGLDAVQMDATAAANKTKGGHQADISNYVASPFQRIFGSSRRVQNSPCSQPALATSGSVLEVSSNPSAVAGAMAGGAGSPSVRSCESSRHSTLQSIRNSILRSMRSSSGQHEASPVVNTMPSSPPEVKPLLAKTQLADVPQITQTPPSVNLPRRSRTMATAVHHESPLKARQSLSDIRVESASPTDSPHRSSADSHPTANGTHTVHQSTSSSDVSTSSQSLTNDTLAKNDSAMTSAANMPTHKPNGVAHSVDASTAGKDLVEFVEKSIASGLDPSLSTSNSTNPQDR